MNYKYSSNITINLARYDTGSIHFFGIQKYNSRLIKTPRHAMSNDNPIGGQKGVPCRHFIEDNEG